MTPEKLAIEIISGQDVPKRFRIRPTKLGPDKVVRFYDPSDSRTWAYVVVDNLVRGASLGGIRLAPDVTAEEVYHLAAAMTFKSAAAMLPLGGGKAGIICSPEYYQRNPNEKKKRMTAFAEGL